MTRGLSLSTSQAGQMDMVRRDHRFEECDDDAPGGAVDLAQLDRLFDAHGLDVHGPEVVFGRIMAPDAPMPVLRDASAIKGLELHHGWSTPESTALWTAF